MGIGVQLLMLRPSAFWEVELIFLGRDRARPIKVQAPRGETKVVDEQFEARSSGRDDDDNARMAEISTT